MKRFAINVLQGAVLIVLLIVASYVSMGRIIFANIDRFESNIERLLADAINVPVSIDGISGDWVYLDPQLRVDRLVLGGDESTSIEASDVFARVDAIASLREGDIVIRDLSAGGLTLAVRQDDQGDWYIEGLPRTGTGFNVAPLLASIPHLKLVDVTGVNVTVNGRNRQYHLTNQTGLPLALVDEGGTKHVSMPLLFRGEVDIDQFELLGRYEGDPRDLDRFTADLYLQLPELELSDFLPPSMGDRMAAFVAQGEFWFTSDQGEFELRGSPIVKRLELATGERGFTLLKNLSATISLWGETTAAMELQVADLATVIGSRQWGAENLNVAFRRDGDQWRIGALVPEVDVEAVAAVVAEVAPRLGIVDDEAMQAVRAVAPRGTVSDLLILFSSDSGWEPRVVARLEDLGLDSWRGSPSITNLDGLVSLSGQHGHVDVHNDEPYTLGLQPLFEEPWPFDSTHARLHYRLDDGGVRIWSDLMAASTGDLNAHARIHLNLTQEKEQRTWGMEIGIRDAPLLEAHRYLPTTLGEDLVSWLNAGIEGGVARTSGLLFHGGLDKTAPRVSKVYELFFDVDDAVLEYSPEFPPVRQLDAMVYIGTWGVRSDGAKGRVYETAITGGIVDMPMSIDHPPDTVRVTGALDGTLADAIRILNETPVAAATDHMARGWIGQGGLAGSIRLDIPLGVRQGEGVGVDVSADLKDNEIFMAPYDLRVEDLEGDISYATSKGLACEGFTATLFGEPVDGRIETEMGASGGATRVIVDGDVDVEKLREWSGQVILTRASGRLGYDAVLHVPFGERAAELTYVEAKSGLDGVAIDLPAPMGKPAGSQKSLSYRQSFIDQGYRIDLELGERTRASLKAVEGFIRGGRIHFGGVPMGAVAYDRLRVSGSLDRVDYDEWDDLMRFLDRQSEASLEAEMAQTLDAIDVDVAEMHAFGTELVDVKTYITREPPFWNVKLENEMLSGLIRVPDAQEAPLDVSLDYLRLEGEGDENVDPLADVDPRDFAAIDVHLAEVRVGEEDYGTWEFEFRPNDTGAVLSDLTAKVKGVEIEPDSTVTWTVADGKQTSRYEGPFSAPDLGTALEDWGFASSIEGKGFRFDANVTWPGSPVMIDLDTLSGLVRLHEGKGRFVQVESGTDALRLLGIFDFASLARRFQFDFSDIVDDGFTFSEIRGLVRLDRGLLKVVDPIVIVGSSSTFKVGGSVNLETTELDNDMIVTLPVSRNLPWYAAYSAIATGPITGAGVWLAQKVFEKQINTMTSAKYKITGTVDEPYIKFVSIFDDSVRETPAEEPAEASEPDGNGTSE